VKRNGEIRWIGHVCRCIIINGVNLGIRVSNRDITEKVNAENKLLNITVDVEERERYRFSSELHDGMGPLLSTIKLYFQWLADTDDIEKKKIISEKGSYSIEMAIQTARELARGLSSQFISNAGYVKALNYYTNRINLTNTININFTANTNDRFSGFFELMLYRITTELIKNTLTYAMATNVDIMFSHNVSKNIIMFSYSDNGIGFDCEKILDDKKGLGLINIQQRVQIMKGHITIKSKPGEGMTTIIQFPIDETLNTKT
jgi:signal transduction histidine kinase